ncbi:lipoprotein [Streptomyces zinciresistens K42]|uniref:Lipoprotein n=1 Tax=Streptomyces zinciresistens K42 TaxID=700597 RepID=G2GBZ0_9ACTN|nr:lipoprotein [Streptomyces zinciresistens K42]
MLLLAVTACGGGGGSDAPGGDKDGDSSAARAEAPRAVVSIAPEDGAKSVGTSGALKVTAARGRLTEVQVEDGKGRAIAGKISGDGATWTPSTHLAAAAAYTVRAVAENADGTRTAEKSGFTTLTPKSTFTGRFTPEDGAKVGVGMPFSVRFDRGITNREDVAAAITVKTDPPVEVAGRWFGDDRLDLRPEKYWKPGTKVTVDLNLDGVEGRPGVYGEQARKTTFTVGRSQVSVVDVKTKKMKVTRDGKVIRTIPISAGAPGYDTWSGQMVMTEKLLETRMNGATVGYAGQYDIPDVPHAIRLTESGTFIHGNYWGGDAFGKTNASHGCVGLRDVKGRGDPKTPAAWFFRNSIIGDVVVVKNSKERTVAPDNGLNGWNIPWKQWKS